MRFFPRPVRIPMLLSIPALAPLAMLIYWMWRVRVRGRLPATRRYIVDSPSMIQKLASGR
jgi:uncharacterized iron-regulated membrane protein